MSSTITLPEITIIGDANAQPQNANDWWCEGFMTGYNDPAGAAERPLMINDELASAFGLGFTAGQESAATVQAELEAELGPHQELTSGIRGKSLEKAEREFREQLEKFFEKEMPHTETESETGSPAMPTIGLVE
jgi:hypothetical protein